MKEIKNGNSLTTQEQISKSYRRFEILLDHHQIPQEERARRWVDIYEQVENNPTKMVSEIGGYWDSTFGSNGKEKTNQNSSNNGVPSVLTGDSKSLFDTEADKYIRRRSSRIEAYENTKHGGPKKARKKARKAKR